jgi:hypothetical protein
VYEPGKQRLCEKPMTARDAVIQAEVELGMSREEAELMARCSDAFLPEAAGLISSPIEPGCERALIEELKQIFRKMDASHEAIREHLRSEMARRAKKN